MSRMKPSIPMKIVLIFVALLLPFYTLLFLSVHSYLRSIEKQEIQSTQSVLNLQVSQLTGEMNRINRILHNVTENNSHFYRLLRWKGEDQDILSLMNINTYLYEQNTISVYPEAFFLNMGNEEALPFLFVDSKINPLASIALRSDLRCSPLAETPTVWGIVSLEGVSYLGMIQESGGVFIGALIHIEDVISHMEAALPEGVSRVSLEPFPESAQYITVESSLPYTNNIFYASIDKAFIRQTMPFFARTVIVIGVLTTIILPVFLISFFMRIIAGPLRKIEAGIVRFGSGEQDYRIPPFRASSEFLSMRDSFNVMADEIHTLKIRQYEEQLEKEQMQLQNVLLQIRPHFLLNFFNQIYSFAELEDYDGIKQSVLYLSRFFRYLFRSERIATYRSELDLVKSYLELMETRFTDCFTVDWEIDESLLPYRIPPLIVQNFVENIFKYAVSDINLIRIRLTLQAEGTWVVMTVEDDGPGIDESSLAQIRAGKPIEKEDGTHIGIYNALYRLKKLCGEKCELEITSVLTEGTKVRILLPRKEKP